MAVNTKLPLDGHTTKGVAEIVADYLCGVLADLAGPARHLLSVMVFRDAAGIDHAIRVFFNDDVITDLDYGLLVDKFFDRDFACIKQYCEAVVSTSDDIQSYNSAAEKRMRNNALATYNQQRFSESLRQSMAPAQGGAGMLGIAPAPLYTYQTYGVGVTTDLAETLFGAVPSINQRVMTYTERWNRQMAKLCEKERLSQAQNYFGDAKNS